MRRAQQQVITFPAIDSTLTTGARKSGLTLLASDVKIAKDGGAFVSATNAPAEIGSTGRYALILTAAESHCSQLHLYVEKTGMQPHDQYGVLDAQPSALVVADGSNTATTFITSLTEASTDFWRSAGLVFTSGALKWQVREVLSYNGTTKAITLAVPLTAIPAAGDYFTIING
jgi:hypothetical protein